MSSKSFKILLLLVWILGVAAATVCLANDHHSCCPTQVADWHMDEVQGGLSYNVTPVLIKSSILADNESLDRPSFMIAYPIDELPPPFYLLTKFIHPTNAPPVV